MNHQSGELPLYQHISQNEFVTRKHTKQNEEDIAVCECIYDPANGDCACGETCLNVLTSTECTPGHCPCGVFCKNQKFQKCEYAKTRFFKTEGRGWGLLADENIQAGQFVIEYCGEVITWTEARRRSHAYELQGIKDAYIICLNASECIDATAKGSHARFINHSCQPNCETRKWNVLGEIRVGVFAKQDIPAGTELGYNYNFEWYGGAKVRCLCGSPNCSGFLGAKSRGFQEDTYVWEDDDDRYSVEKIPLYDSAEDELAVELPKTLELSKSECDLKGENEYSTSLTMNASIKFEHQIESTSLPQSLESSPMEGIVLSATKSEESEEMKLYKQGAHGVFPKKGAMISRIRGNSTCCNYNIGSGSMPKRWSQHYSNGKLKQRAQKQVDAKHVVQFLALKEAQEEVLRYEEKKNEAASQLASLYDEIRPAIEEHERDSQDSVATSVAEKWIEASCMKMKTEFDLYSAVIKNLACTPIKAKTPDQPKPSEAGDNGSEKKSLGS